MLKPMRPFNIGLLLLLAVLAGWNPSLFADAGAAEAAPQYKKNPTSFYKDIFDQEVFYEGTQDLDLEHVYNTITFKKPRAVNVNVYDEVPDSPFFTNRQGRKKMSISELEKGYSETEGPDSQGELLIYDGKFEGLHPGFFVQDAKGDKYLFKFDAIGYLELATSAEVIASRFYYAIGYNVPQYTVFTFSREQLAIGEGVKFYDDSGFKKELTPQRLENYLAFIPQDDQANYRASASKILAGENLGSFSFTGRRKNDPNDPVEHKDMREIRALQVFSAWLNNYDVRESNTLDMLVEENGQQVIKHYLIDFNNALGAAFDGPKPAMYGYQHMVDYEIIVKNFVTLGLFALPWQKQKEEAAKDMSQSPAVGYFHNKYFYPPKYRVQLPYEAFRGVTRADGFWAAKIIMSFSNDDIRAMVNAGQFSRSEDSELITNLLIERRDLIGKYWFNKANPLDEFDIQGNNLTFKDLAVEYKFREAEETKYIIDVVNTSGKKKQKLASLESRAPSISMDSNWVAGAESVDIWIRVQRGSDKPGPYVFLEVNHQGIQRIVHQD